MPWDSGVNPPKGGSYTVSLVNFGQFADWGPDDPAKLRKEQEAKAFQQGLPIDPRTGQTDAKAVAATALKFGDFPLLERLMPFIQQQEQNQPSPFFGGQQLRQSDHWRHARRKPASPALAIADA
jgi:hypothetical protein